MMLRYGLVGCILIFIGSIAPAAGANTCNDAMDRSDFRAALQDCAAAAQPSANDPGNAFAQGAVGIIYKFGLGVPVDLQRAAYWLGLAARQGNAGAQYQLGDLYFYHDSDHTSGDKQALYWYTQAAQQGDLRAMSTLGAMYALGVVVPVDLTHAICSATIWMRKSGNLDENFLAAM